MDQTRQPRQQHTFIDVFNTYFGFWVPTLKQIHTEGNTTRYLVVIAALSYRAPLDLCIHW